MLVNNAGIMKLAKIADSDDAMFDQQIAINLKSVYLACKAVLPVMERQGGGAIVNVSSVAGEVSVGTGAVYAMTKAAIEQLTRYLAVEWAGDGIRVNAVAPWYTRTPLVEPVLGDPVALERLIARTPMRRVAEPEEIAAVVAFLCLPAASYVTGQILAADGGFLAFGYSPKP